MSLKIWLASGRDFIILLNNSPQAGFIHFSLKTKGKVALYFLHCSEVASIISQMAWWSFISSLAFSVLAPKAIAAAHISCCCDTNKFFVCPIKSTPQQRFLRLSLHGTIKSIIWPLNCLIKSISCFYCITWPELFCIHEFSDGKIGFFACEPPLLCIVFPVAQR